NSDRAAWKPSRMRRWRMWASKGRSEKAGGPILFYLRHSPHVKSGRPSLLYAQDDLSQDVPLFEPLVRLGSVGQCELRRNRHLERGRFDCARESVKLTAAGRAIVGFRFDSAPMPGLGLDPVRIGEPSTLPKSVE